MNILPENLRGPFESGYYVKSKARLLLKKKGSYQIVDDVFPAMFVPSRRVKFLPDLSKFVTGVVNEGAYHRFLLNPDTKRSDIDYILAACKDCKVYPLEADVDPLRRWFSDTGAAVSITGSAFFFDLETVPRGKPGFDDEAKAEHQIISISAHDLNGKQYFWCNTTCDDAGEERVIKQFLDVAKNYDTLLAWNGNDYDFFVLKARCDHLDIYVEWHKWNLLDYMLVVKKCLMSVSDPKFKRSFALDNIGQNVLGIKKLEISVLKTEMDRLIKEGHIEELKAYNSRDVEIMTELEHKREFLMLHQAVCAICRKFPDRNSLFPNTLMDGVMLRLAVEEGRHFKSRYANIDSDDEEVKFPGAFVMDAVLGYHENVQVIDFASLYPSIIISWNISPDTKVAEFTPEDIVKNHSCFASASGIRFRTDREGLLPMALRQLIEKRKEYSKKQKEATVGTEEWKRYGHESTALKVVANSMYGLLGSPYSRYYDTDLAKSVTLTGQYLIKEVIAFTQSLGFQVIASDSITGNRPVVLMSPDNQIVIDTIERIWDKAKNVEKYFNIEEKEAGTLKGWKALSNGKWYPIKAIIRHKSNKTVYSIWNKFGQTEVTEDHSFVVKGQRVTPKEIIERRHFERSDIPQIDTINTIDLWDYLKNYRVDHEYKTRLVTLRFKVQDDNIVCIGWGTPTITFKRFYNSNSPELKALLEVCADYITEGSSSIKRQTCDRYLLSFSQQERNWLEHTKQNLRIVTNCKLSGPTWSEGSNSYWLRSGASCMALFFDALCGHTSRGKRLPNFVYNLTDSDWDIFWKRLLTGDGYQTKYGTYNYTTISSALAAGIVFSLRQRGRRYSINYRKSKKSWSILATSNRFKFRPYKTSYETRKLDNEYVYDLSVETSEMFVDGVGCIHLHNTDSSFIKATQEQTKEIVKRVNSELIPKLLNESRCRAIAVKMDYDKGYSRLLIQAKKKYAGQLSLHKGNPAPPDMEPDIKGLEFQRSDQIKYAQRMQMSFVKLLLDPNAHIKDIENEIRKYADEFFNGDIKREDIEITQAVTKKPEEYPNPTPAVRVAAQMLRDGRDFAVGMKVPYIIASSQKDMVNAIHADDYDGNFDRKYYWTKKVIPLVERLVRVRFQDCYFDQLDTLIKNPNQGTFEFDSMPMKTRKPKLPDVPQVGVKVRKAKHKSVRFIFEEQNVVYTTPKEQVIKAVAKLVKASKPGNIKLTLIVVTQRAEIVLGTDVLVTQECIDEVRKMFPSCVKIEE